MGTIKEYFDKLISFLAEYDIRKILEAIRQLEWQEQLANPIAWLVVLPPLIYLIWKQQIRLLVLLCSFVLFLWLLQSTLPQSGETISLHKLLQFLGGSMVLIGVNVYFFFVREK